MAALIQNESYCVFRFMYTLIDAINVLFAQVLVKLALAC